MDENDGSVSPQDSAPPSPVCPGDLNEPDSDSSDNILPDSSPVHPNSSPVYRFSPPSSPVYKRRRRNVTQATNPADCHHDNDVLCFEEEFRSESPIAEDVPEAVGQKFYEDLEEKSDSDSSGQSSDSETRPLSASVLIDSDESDAQSDDCDYSSDSSNEFDYQEYLWEGCNRLTEDVILEFLEIYLKHKSSISHLESQLKLFVSCLPVNHNMPTTKWHLFQYLKSLAPPIDHKCHFYCASNNMHCVEAGTNHCGPCDSRVHYFFEFPIVEIMKYLLDHRDLYTIINKYRTEKAASGSNHICDVLDGSEYKRVWEDQHDCEKITLIVNTDGVQPYKDSSVKFWPLMCTIMEVPPLLRSSFIFVWGIWFDKVKKPDMNIFLKPFVLSLRKVFENGGMRWTNAKTGKEITIQVTAPLIVADAPARADVQGIQQHNSKYACNTCEQKTVKLPAPPVVLGQAKERRKRRFVFKEEPSVQRDHERMLGQGYYVLQHDRVTNKKGVSTVSVIKELPALDLSTCVLAEYMHGVLKGVVLQISLLWFFTAGPWYIGKHIKNINAFLSTEINPPDFVTRLPRGVDGIAKWKANELRSWLLYYSLIVLRPYLPDQYWQHWSLLVCSVYILLAEKICDADLNAAEIMIRMFVRDIGKLYGNVNYVYNVHQLLHLVTYVRRWGPLWATSAFQFESFNGVLAKMIHSTKNQGKEIVNQLKRSHGIQILRNLHRSRNETDPNFVEVIDATAFKLSEAQAAAFKNIDVSLLQFFSRARVGRYMFSSKLYDKGFKRRNSYVEMYSNGLKCYGRIVVFCKYTDIILCLVSVLRAVHTKVFFHATTLRRVNHIIPVSETGNYLVISIKDILQKLIRVGDCLCVRPNSVEVNL